MSAPFPIKSRLSQSFVIPERLQRLTDLAYNLRWTWNTETQKIFETLAPKIWQRSKNPVVVLGSIHDFSAVLENQAFLERFDSACADLDAYLNESANTWHGQKAGTAKQAAQQNPVAYFCAEYGLHESFPGYSGGLGILAGDHCKAASDLNLPFLAMGLLYRNGYFRQVIDPDGRQEHNYPEFVTSELPLHRVLQENGTDELYINVDIGDRKVACGVWMAQVGRIPLFLLDTNNERNSAEDREITRLLYVRGREMRLAQEIVLGVGGVRALQEMGIKPSTWHLNEGHSAFMVVERIGQHMKETGSDFKTAVSALEKNSVFTIHTPVPAGNEVFGRDLVLRFAKPIFESNGIDAEDVLALGTGVSGDKGAFDMTAFCLRMANFCNGVSLLHGKTAHDTWNSITGRNIIGVTNGVHMPTWLGLETQQLLEKHSLSLSELDLMAVDPEKVQSHIHSKVAEIPNEEFWTSHQQQKQASAEVIKSRLRNQLARNGLDPEGISQHTETFKQNVLTIGFARRFATYKRAALLFTDPERLQKILDNSQRPVQLLFAGKAHPADKPGQALIQDIVSKVQKYNLNHRIFFVEDYDMEIGRALVQGVDIWLNNPRRPLEASGTSGMKAAANGIPNVSILDGWWDEGFAGDNGWAIGSREVLSNETLQDKNDAESLYSLLEDEVSKKFYSSGNGNCPTEWVQVMKRAMATSLFAFSTTRMLSDYSEKMYSEAGLGS